MHEPIITFSGNLAAKPQARPVDTPQGPVLVANMRVAVTPRRRPRGADDWSDGETMWFDVSAWRSTATNSIASLEQGDRVVVRGRLTQRTWQDDKGGERFSLAVDAEDVALDLSRHPARSMRPTPAQRPGPVPAASAAEWTGDLPSGTDDDVLADPAHDELAGEPAPV